MGELAALIFNGRGQRAFWRQKDFLRVSNPDPIDKNTEAAIITPHISKREKLMTCQECGEDVDELISMKVGSKRRKLCEECAELAEEEMAIAEEAESAMQGMMEYKGR